MSDRFDWQLKDVLCAKLLFYHKKLEMFLIKDRILSTQSTAVATTHLDRYSITFALPLLSLTATRISLPICQNGQRSLSRISRDEKRLEVAGAEWSIKLIYIIVHPCHYSWLNSPRLQTACAVTCSIPYSSSQRGPLLLLTHCFGDIKV